MSDARRIQGEEEDDVGGGGDGRDDNDGNDNDDDGLLARIGALPSPAIDPGVLARVRDNARAAYRDAAVLSLPAGTGPWARAWNRILEPIIVTGVVAGYFAWTAAALGALR